MIYYNDMAYCSSETCTNMECARNKKHIPKYIDTPVFFIDLEKSCVKYDNKVIDSPNNTWYNKEEDDE